MGGNGVLLDAVNQSISDDQNVELTEQFSMHEFESAIKSMHPENSSDPDGFNPAFYQK